MTDKKQLKRPYQEYESGSFIAQFEIAIAPLRDKITRVEDSNAALRKEIKALRLAISDANRIARTATVKSSKTLKPMIRTKKFNIKKLDVYADIILHLRENFRQVDLVQKAVLLAGGGMTVNNFRAYLARTFDHKISSETYLTNYNLHSLVRDAGLGKVYKHTLLDSEGKDRLFLFYKFVEKES
jgi:hypothetical protein